MRWVQGIHGETSTTIHASLYDGYLERRNPMTGRDLILHILKNNLENEPVFEDGKFIGFITIGEAASKMNVGLATIAAWISSGRIDCVLIGGTVYVPCNFELPLDVDG